MDKCEWKPSKHDGKQCPIHYNRVTELTKTNFLDYFTEEQYNKFLEIVEVMDLIKPTNIKEIKIGVIETDGQRIAGRITLLGNDEIMLEFDPTIADCDEYPYNNFEAIIYHEFGHLIQTEVESKNRIFSLGVYVFLAQNYDKVKEEMGEYAVTNQMEFLAECVAYHYALNGYSPIAEEWYEKLMKEWKKQNGL